MFPAYTEVFPLKQKIDGALFRRMVISASAAVDLNKQKINELNVFPVPDGDTGTNMGMTLGSAAADLKKNESPTLTKAADIARQFRRYSLPSLPRLLNGLEGQA